MRNLLAFIWRHHFFLLFMILEILCVILIANHSYYQRASIVRTTNNITGSLYKTSNSIVQYFALKRANRDLARENVRLKNLVDKNTYVLDSISRISSLDSVKQKFFYRKAHVISNSTGKRNNYIMLNRGQLDGLEKNMAVIAPNGIVGIVVEVSPKYSTVMSVLHKESRISSKLKKNNQIGTLIWNGINYRKGTVTDIPAHVFINIGDTVVTSGFSHIFPEGIPIGVVSDFSVDEGNNFYTLEIDFMVDYNSLSFVEIIKNRETEEIRNLENKSEQE